MDDKNKELWEVADHSCRHCLGRVLIRTKHDGSATARCAECGKRAEGDHELLCWCGAEVNGHGHIFECFRNPNLTAASPQEILVREKPVPKDMERLQVMRSNPVRLSEL